MPTQWRDLIERHLATAAQRRILLIEDDDVHVERIRRALIDTHASSFVLEVSRTLAHAENAIKTSRFDLFLLDLGLPDAHGMNTFVRVHRLVRPRPVVVLSSADDPELASRLLYLGAQDYLVKGASEELLMHVIGRAIGRTAPEAGRLPMIEADPAAGVPLAGRDTEQFAVLVDEYGAIVDASMRRRVFDDEATTFRELLRVLGEQLGRADATARDALEIHAAAVRHGVRNGGPDLDAWVQESRLVALELMGQLTEYYRTRSIEQG